MNSDNYRPQQKGIAKDIMQSVSYQEQKPNDTLRDVIYCFWTLQSLVQLDEDFIYNVMPDACIDIIFDISTKSKPIIMTPRLHAENMNLGKTFHYVGIRFKPGVFVNTAVTINEVVGQQREIGKIIDLDVAGFAAAIRSAKTKQEQYKVLETLVAALQDSKIIQKNAFIDAAVQEIQLGQTLDVTAQKLGYSPRQLRRKITAQTGFSPIQLQRILRFQMALASQDVTLRFADQSHLIKEFKAITGTSHRLFINTFK